MSQSETREKHTAGATRGKSRVAQFLPTVGRKNTARLF